MVRMEDCRIPNQALNLNLSSTNRIPRRTPKNWEGIIRRDLKDIGLTWDDEASELAHSRRSWRQRVAQCVFDTGWTQVSTDRQTETQETEPSDWLAAAWTRWLGEWACPTNTTSYRSWRTGTDSDWGEPTDPTPRHGGPTHTHTHTHAHTQTKKCLKITSAWWC